MATLTVPIAASSDDGRVYTAGATYPPTTGAFGDDTTTTIYARRELDTGTYRIGQILLRFDTSALPDNAVISSATLRFYLSAGGNPDGLSAVGEYYNWGVSADGSDWAQHPPVSPCFSVLLSSLVGGSNDVAITDLSGISLTGLTYFRIHLSERASDAAPSGSNLLGIAAFDDTVNPEAQLIINYTTPGQYSRPSADVAAGGWTPSTGTSLFSTLDETVADDADYISATAT